MKKYIVIIAFLIWLILTLIGGEAYLGSMATFIVFSVVAALMGATAWLGQKSYFYIFISTFWMLGFWMKVNVHVIFSLDFGEAIGGFDNSAAAWDHALLVSTIAMFAAFIFRLVQLFTLNKREIDWNIQISAENVPQWYVRFSLWIWFVTLSVIACVAVFNFRLGVFQIGMMPHVLPFKLNAIIAALFNLGFPFWMATLIWWDVCLQRSFFSRFMGVIFEAVMSSVSMLSRGTYVFHILHYLVSSFFYLKVLRLSRSGYAMLVGLIISGVVFTAVLTNSLRSHFYSQLTQSQLDQASTEQQKIDYKKSNQNKVLQNPIVSSPQVYDDLAQYRVLQSPSKHLGIENVMVNAGYSYSLAALVTLIVDRWIGIEGAMAVSSYDQLGEHLFIHGWLEKPSLSSKTVYNYIANSIYVNPRPNTNAETLLFSTTPGLVAMLYYSGSYLIVFVGILLFLSIAGLVEYFVLKVMGNPFVASFLAIFISNMIAQFGGLHQFVVLCVEIGAILGAITVVQKSGVKNQAFSHNNSKSKPL